MQLPITGVIWKEHYNVYHDILCAWMKNNLYVQSVPFAAKLLHLFHRRLHASNNVACSTLWKQLSYSLHSWKQHILKRQDEASLKLFQAVPAFFSFIILQCGVNRSVDAQQQVYWGSLAMYGLDKALTVWNGLVRNQAPRIAFLHQTFQTWACDETAASLTSTQLGLSLQAFRCQ